MEEFTFSFPEYEVLKKHRARLEKCFDVRICLPDLGGQNQSPSVYHIEGEPRNITYVKKFLRREMDKKTETNSQKTNEKPAVGTVEPQESIPVITIDDEEDDFSEAQTTKKTRVIRKKKSKVPKTNNQASRNGNITSGSFSHASKNKNVVSSSSSTKQSVVTKNSQSTNVDSPSSCSSSECGSSNSPENNQNADESIIILQEVIVSSTSATKQDKKSSRWQKDSSSLKDSSKVTKPLPEFIPLRVRNVQLPCNGDKKRKLKGNECVGIPASKERRVLRPIVIDGSNVARFHGRPFNTFSCKGIKICVDYFLKRGHTDIKVLLPHFKRFMSHGSVVTTDGELLDELDQLNMVVYTPSRRVNEKRITCYDDRFIVSLASQNNGVIVSNDNYRDIIMESEEFKKTIEERLLMFCFAGDIIMIPEDPLGVNGPTLSDFLSMRV